MTAFRREADDILAELATMRAADAPTHGGRVLSYVYDPGLPELDELAAEAARLVQPVNGLDPTAFPSAAALERAVVGFARRVFRGDDEVVGSVTSGGTESCLLAVRSARDAWRAGGGTGTPRLVAPSTAHAAFRKAAELFGLTFDEVPVSIATGAPIVDGIVDRLGPDVALVVLSAPSYPFGGLDPIATIAPLAAERGVPVHVDACIGGFALAFAADRAEGWDFAVPGVTTLSADLHKYGYAPKGVSVLLTRGRDRHRVQYFASARWPGYPVVNPTLLGSRSIAPLAAAWAIVEALGDDGFRDLAARAATATRLLREAVDGTLGLRVVGDPIGPLFAVGSDVSIAAADRVDPHHWIDAVRARGWALQAQPAYGQVDGTRLPRTAHVTVTPVTAGVLAELLPALVAAADDVRGVPPVDAAAVVPVDDLRALADATLDAEQAAAFLARLGLGGGELPDRMAPVLALVEALPPETAERLLVELLARLVEP